MTFTVVLLAGGLSQRMGADKAVQTFGGQFLWQRQLELLHALQPAAIVVSARSRPEWCPADIEVITDAPPSCGPLSGLTAVLNQLRTTHLLALAIDLPQMPVEHLRQLRSLAQPGVGVMPRTGDYFEPLAAIYPAEAGGFAAQALARGDYSLQSLAQKLLENNRVQTYLLSRVERAYYHNANTPDDLK